MVHPLTVHNIRIWDDLQTDVHVGQLAMSDVLIETTNSQSLSAILKKPGRYI